MLKVAESVVADTLTCIRRDICRNSQGLLMTILETYDGGANDYESADGPLIVMERPEATLAQGCATLSNEFPPTMTVGFG